MRVTSFVVVAVKMVRLSGSHAWRHATRHGCTQANKEREQRGEDQGTREEELCRGSSRADHNTEGTTVWDETDTLIYMCTYLHPEMSAFHQ